MARLAGQKAPRRPACGGAGCAVLGLLLGAAAGHRAVRTAGPVVDLAAERAVVTVRATVAAEPRAVRGASHGAEDRPAAPPAVTVVRLDVRRCPVVVARPPSAHRSSSSVTARTGRALRWHDEVQVVVRLAPADPGDDVVAVATPKDAVRVVAGPGRRLRGGRCRPRTLPFGDGRPLARCPGARAGAGRRRHLAHPARPHGGHARDGAQPPQCGLRQQRDVRPRCRPLGLRNLRHPAPRGGHRWPPSGCSASWSWPAPSRVS